MGNWCFLKQGKPCRKQKIRAMMGMGLPKLVLEDQCMDSTVKSIVPDGRPAPVLLCESIALEEPSVAMEASSIMRVFWSTS